MSSVAIWRWVYRLVVGRRCAVMIRFKPLRAFDVHVIAIISGADTLLEGSVAHLRVEKDAPVSFRATSTAVSICKKSWTRLRVLKGADPIRFTRHAMTTSALSIKFAYRRHTTICTIIKFRGILTVSITRISVSI